MLAAASAIIELIFENTVLMLLAIFGIKAPPLLPRNPPSTLIRSGPGPGFRPPIASFSNE